VNVENWTPFAPNGIKGVLGGVSAVFFAYIGFDAISTTAEECKNPKVDLPRSMMLSLIICTVLYIAVTLVLTGIIPYYNLGVGDPLAFVFEQKGITWMSKIVAVSAVIAIASVLLVFQMGQPRIWMSMSRDGLLPKKFSKIHPRFKTPSFATIITGLLVSIPALFMNLKEVTDLTSIGTLFAFVLVCGGVIKMESHKMDVKPKFHVPYVNSRFIVPALYLLAWFVALLNYSTDVKEFFTLSSLTPERTSTFDVFLHQIPQFSFLILATWIAIKSFTQQLSLIPVLGLVVNFYLMTELGISNWIGFGIWLLAGLIIYFGFGFKNSRLAKEHN
jgi:amino acid transporter